MSKGEQMNYLRLDLKVCEGCGALWLRSETTAGVYCRNCAAKLAEFPAPRRRRSTRVRPARVVRTGCNGARTGSAGGAR